MKKLIATLIACGLVFQTCAFASVTNFTLDYDRATNEIDLDVTVGYENNAPVIVTVGKSGETLSRTNLPEFMYLYKTGDGGDLVESIELDDTIVSGKYTVYIDTAEDSEEMDIMVVNENDNSDGGTNHVMYVDIAGAADADALETIISDANKMDKLGIDPDLMAARAQFTGYAAEVMFARKGSGWSTIDAFIDEYNRALALSSAKAGKNLDKVMASYADEFGTTLEAFNALTTDQKAYAADYFKDIDYINDDIAQMYEDMFILMDYKTADAWGELREVIETKREAGECDFDFEAYDEIDVERQEDVFSRLKAAIADPECDTVEEIADAFHDITYDVLDEQYNNIGGDEDEDYNTDWGDNDKDIPDNEVSDVPAPSKPGTAPIIKPGTENSSKYDEETEKATPAPTVTPVETEAPTEAPVVPGEFADMTDHWAKDYVDRLFDDGVIGGYDDNTFRPNQNVTRAEYIKMIVGMFNLTETSENIFTDVDASAWYTEYIEKALAAGLITGDGGKFNPNDTITRQDAAVILYRLGVKAGETEITFADEADVSDYATEAVKCLASAGIINGSDGNFNPKNAITRAETAAILCRTADLPAEDEAETPAEDEAETPAEDEAETPVEDEAETPAEDEAETPVEDEAEAPAEDEAEAPAKDEAEEVTEETTEETTEEVTE